MKKSDFRLEISVSRGKSRGITSAYSRSGKLLDVSGGVLTKPAAGRTTEISERHLVWLMWFAMRHGSEARQEQMRVWTFSHIGIDLRVEVRSTGQCQKVVARGRRWTLEFTQEHDEFHVEHVRYANSFWRDLTVMRLCDESPIPS